jgi:FKBP-type peptidyl-prolyl cis-trans isomerase FkpA
MQYHQLSAAVIVSVIISITAKATNKDSTIHFLLPDSVKASSFITDVRIGDIKTKKEINAGIRIGDVSILLGTEKNKKEIEFEFPENATLKAWGIGTDTSDKGEIVWKYNWMPNEIYKLMLSIASDSAENFTLYSGYVFLPKENKWKLIGNCKVLGHWGTIKSPTAFISVPKKNAPVINFENTWCQRTNGYWKKLSETNSVMPMVNLFSHIDSTQQTQIEKELISKAVANGKIEALQIKDDILYTILKTGTGSEIKVSDTVTAYYKGYLFPDGIIFDQTKDKPAVFPLKRLIRGWQVALPLCRVGSKIKVVIPSAQAYSIRTRGAKIPPNSILVFEIEIVDTKEGN